MKKIFVTALYIGSIFLMADAPANPISSTPPMQTASQGIQPAPANPLHTNKAPVWTTVVDEDGVQIQSKDSGIDNLLSFKAHTKIHATRERIQRELLDVKQYVQWIPRTAEIVVLKDTDFKKEVFFFGKGNGFFPVLTDRNLIVRLDVREETSSHSLLVMEGVPPTSLANVPPLSGILIPYIRLEWSLRDIAKNSTEVGLFLTADPGGAIPDWIVNLAMKKYPLHTLQALRKRVQPQ